MTDPRVIVALCVLLLVVLAGVLLAYRLPGVSS